MSASAFCGGPIARAYSQPESQQPDKQETGQRHRSRAAHLVVERWNLINPLEHCEKRNRWQYESKKHEKTRASQSLTWAAPDMF
jgi:hypothetical protein